MSTTLQVHIVRKHVHGGDVCEIDFARADGSDLPAFTAGAHIDLHLPGGLVRAYSLCNDPADRTIYRVAVLRDRNSRGGSVAVHDALQEGQTLTISEPRNLFALDASAPHHLLLGGGIGVTPLMSMAYALQTSGASHAMVWSFPSRSRAAFLEPVWQAWCDSTLRPHIDEEHGGLLQFGPLLASQPAGTHLYVCGPQGFIDAALAAGRAAGWDESRLHSEQFGAKPVQAGSEGFTVRLARSHQCVQVGPTESITDVLARHGIQVATSCEQGVCGACVTTVLAGEPDHQDMFLTPEEQASNKLMTPCCSRSKSSELTLDL